MLTPQEHPLLKGDWNITACSSPTPEELAAREALVASHNQRWAAIRQDINRTAMYASLEQSRSALRVVNVASEDVPGEEEEEQARPNSPTPSLDGTPRLDFPTLPAHIFQDIDRPLAPLPPDLDLEGYYRVLAEIPVSDAFDFAFETPEPESPPQPLPASVIWGPPPTAPPNRLLPALPVQAHRDDSVWSGTPSTTSGSATLTPSPALPRPFSFTEGDELAPLPCRFSFSSGQDNITVIRRAATAPVIAATAPVVASQPPTATRNFSIFIPLHRLGTWDQVPQLSQANYQPVRAAVEWLRKIKKDE
jgi:hypothetical protein